MALVSKQKEEGYGSIDVASSSLDDLGEINITTTRTTNPTRFFWVKQSGVALLLASFCIFFFVLTEKANTTDNEKSNSIMMMTTSLGSEQNYLRAPPGGSSLFEMVAETDDGISFDWIPDYNEEEEEDEEAATALYYKDQIVDHFAPPSFDGGADSDSSSATTTFSQRYYTSTKYCHHNKDRKGGDPILMIVGGESKIDRILYPFVTHVLAKDLNACVVQSEHRFWGESQPLGNNEEENVATVQDLNRLLSPEQALADNVRLLRYLKEEVWGCSSTDDAASEGYCPVITIGGSYPGFLSAMMRLVYPDDVDISYASSAPLKLYSQQAHQEDYFEKITMVAETASPGCARAVKETSMGLRKAFLEYGVGVGGDNNNNDNKSSILQAAQDMNLCVHTFPEYINTLDIMVREMQFLVGASYADMNMGYYPPGDEDSDFIRTCKIFQEKKRPAIQKMRRLFELKQNSPNDDSINNTKCYDLRNEYPWQFPNSTISASDWSGVGDDQIWEYLTCTKLIVPAGFSERSMFGTRPWTMDWLNRHCHNRFGVSPQPRSLAEQWHFDDLRKNPNASRILFVNGMNDGWSVSSYTVSLSETLVAVNLQTGAHHSELNSDWDPQRDTEDVRNGHKQIRNILYGWVQDITTTPKAP